ncbi:leucine--tRNA ligase, partial [Candidatus Woesearchaeota archaeon CG08_land_8_20_14_0_20_43_7]
LDIEEVRAIKPIAILDTPGFGQIAAETILKKYNVKTQNERGKLDQIRKELYKASHYTATFNEKYKDRFGIDLHGKKVEDGKDIIKRELVKSGWADSFFQLTGEIVSRSLTECIVKIVSDQWFIDYGNPEWKRDAHKCLDKMKMFPEKARQQFDYVIDWLHEWACTREAGLGTLLPWDEKWLIESLSDSTIYMAYYTISHIIKEIPIGQVDDALFDYIFMKKDVEVKCDKTLADQMRKEFGYWYPVDFRNSGKDLIQNHLSFFIFNHTAIFPEDKWPVGIGVNGWVMVDGQKMSKSLGNMIPVRKVVKEFGPDACRLTILNGGEGMDDPNWETSMVSSLPQKFSQLLSFVKEQYGKGRDEESSIDGWFESVLNRCIRDATKCMEDTMFRSAIKLIFFDLGRMTKQYINRSDGMPNKDIMEKAIEAQLVMLSPFAPHICEEAWESIGKKSYISLAKWPEYDEQKIDDSAEAVQDLVQTVRSDIRAVLSLAKIERPDKITLFIPSSWKYGFVELIKEKMKETRNPGDIIKTVMATDMKKQGQTVMKTIPKLVNDPSKIPAVVLDQEREICALMDAKQSLEKEFLSILNIIKEEESNEQKAKQAMPGKPAILLS